jgi:LuxR family maltose regulon positive regulatory protein
MDAQILTTKLYIPPARSDQVPRPRLFQRLDAGVQQGRRLTVVAAPAGYGKTSLVSAWLHRSDRDAAWLSLDEGDNDPTRFWAYTVAALQSIDPAIGRAILQGIRSPEPPPLDAFPIALINDLVERTQHRRRPLILVFDDYHTITAPAIHRSFDFFLAHLPDTVHVILTTRQQPPLSLSRYRGRGQLTELHAAALQFTLPETAQLFNTVMALDLTIEDVATLSTRTEGWAVGLRMAAISLQRQTPFNQHAFVQAFAGDDRLIVDYLVDDVLASQPPAIHRFLLQTSILERLCGPLCAAVTGQSDSAQTLRALEAANLFIVPLDTQRHWYRYHPLFSELLRHRLERARPPGDLIDLHRRASAWYDHEGFGEDAVSHALQTDDVDRILALTTAHIPPALLRAELVLVNRWLDALDDGPQSRLIRDHPMLCVARAWCVLAHSSDEARRWIGRAEAHLEKDVTPDLHALVTSHVATLNVAIARWLDAPPAKVRELSETALAQIPPSEARLRAIVAFWMGQAALRMGEDTAADRAFDLVTQIERRSGNRTMSLVMGGLRAWRNLAEGRLQEAHAICRHTLRAFADPEEDEARREPMACYPTIVLGQVMLEWNEREQAAHYLAEGIRLAESTTTERPLLNEGYCAMAKLHTLNGDAAHAQAFIRRAEATHDRWMPDSDDVPAHRARLWLLQARRTGDPTTLHQAIAWADANPIKGGDAYNPAWLTQIQIRIDQHRTTGVPDLGPFLTRLEAQIPVAEAEHHLRWQIEVLTLEALALQAQGSQDAARDALIQALTLAKPERFVQHWLDFGATLAPLLREAAESDALRPYVRSLLNAMDAGTQAVHRAPAPASPQDPHRGVDPLTPREQEILAVIATGATNAEIARDLHISINTVKTHITHIYDKLNAAHRTDAVARGRELDLIA